MGKILNWFKNLAEKYLRANNIVKPLLGFFIGVASLLVVGYGFISLINKSDKIARLKHKRDVLAKEKERKTVEKKLEKNDKKFGKLADKIRDLNLSIGDLETEISEEVKDYARKEKQIDAIRNWRSLSNYVESRSGG